MKSTKQLKTFLTRSAFTVAAIVVALCLLFGGEILYATYGFGATTTFVNPAHVPVVLGSGPPLRYVVIGDSTAAGRGATYANGIAMGTARHLASRHRVTMVNLAVSGATFDDVVAGQLTDAVRLRPDVVLCSVGANDVTHFTASARITTDVGLIISELTAAGGSPRIVLTGSPQMGAIPRFAQPLRWLAGVETNRVNRAIHLGTHSPLVTMAPVVDTGPTFAGDPSLFGPDRFHPTDRGYATWLPILDRGLDKSLSVK